MSRPIEEPAPPAPTTTAASPWEGKLGQIVSLEGVAEDAKLGALLMIEGSASIWLDGMDSWPEGLRTRRVKVIGRVIEKHDLPVFVHREGEPWVQGIPVPAGTDLDKASRRFLLTEARWTVVP